MFRNIKSRKQIKYEIQRIREQEQKKIKCKVPVTHADKAFTIGLLEALRWVINEGEIYNPGLINEEKK